MTKPADWHPEAPEQQNRLARLCLAQMEHDGAMAASVFEDLMDDPRGERTATQALLQAFVLSLVDTWTRMGAADTIRAALRSGILDLEHR